jgi:hypothetical protein
LKSSPSSMTTKTCGLQIIHPLMKQTETMQPAHSNCSANSSHVYSSAVRSSYLLGYCSAFIQADQVTAVNRWSI